MTLTTVIRYIDIIINNDDVKQTVLRSDRHEPHQEHHLGTVSNTITEGGGGAAA